MKKEAVIVVDYQNDFANPEGSLYVKGGEKLVEYINSLMQEIKSKAGIIITSQDWHPKDHISFASTFGKNPFEIVQDEVKWPDHCVANTWGSDFLEGFDRELVDRKVLKGFQKNLDSFSSFGGVEFETGKNLNQILKEYEIKVLHIVGLATEYCDFATVKDAKELGYDAIIHKKGIAAVNVNPDDGEKAIQEMKNMGIKIFD